MAGVPFNPYFMGVPNFTQQRIGALMPCVAHMVAFLQ